MSDRCLAVVLLRVLCWARDEVKSWSNVTYRWSERVVNCCGVSIGILSIVAKRIAGSIMTVQVYLQICERSCIACAMCCASVVLAAC